MPHKVVAFNQNDVEYEVKFFDDVFVELVDFMGSDAAIVQAARVSTKGENFSEGSEKDQGLINMLMRDRHGSPFEHCVVKVFVKAPIFVFREWHRHRIASYNEMSGRYRVLEPEFYVPRYDRPLVQVGKPGAYTFTEGTEDQYVGVIDNIEHIAVESWASYQRMLDAGVAKELARAVLPVNTYSQMYCTMNLRALMNFLSLRTKSRPESKVPSFPQHEISLGADKLEAIFAEKFPLTYRAWNDNGRVSP